jgi:hypothetical protein
VKGGGTATMSVAEFPLGDYGNVGNALSGGPGEFAHVSFDVSWGSSSDRVNIRNSQTGFAGQFVRNVATMTWSSKQPGFEYHANANSSDFATVGNERNGVFFNGA